MKRTSGKQLSIIIVNWRSAGYVKDCIRSIQNETSSTDYEIIVIDNGSFDECGEMIAREYPDVIFVQSEKNVGFGRANNLASQYAKGRLVLFLNPDTVIRNGAIDRFMEEYPLLRRAGVVGCRLLNTDGSLQTTSVQSFPSLLREMLDIEFLHRALPTLSLWGVRPLFDGGSEPKRVKAVSGACMLMEREVFDAVGGFSREFFMYSEDVDLCYKVQKAGFVNYYIPSIPVLHHGGSSTQKTSVNAFSVVKMLESRRSFFRRTRSLPYAWSFQFLILWVSLVRVTALSMLWLGLLFGGRSVVVESSLQKWFISLRWSLGGEG